MSTSLTRHTILTNIVPLRPSPLRLEAGTWITVRTHLLLGDIVRIQVTGGSGAQPCAKLIQMSTITNQHLSFVPGKSVINRYFRTNSFDHIQIKVLTDLTEVKQVRSYLFGKPFEAKGVGRFLHPSKFFECRNPFQMRFINL